MGSVFFFNPGFAVEEGNVINRIPTAIKELGPENSFVCYDLHLSDDDIKVLKSLKVSITDEYNNYGNLKDLNSEVRTFIKSLNKENEAIAEATSKIIARIVNDIVRASGQETAWVAVRSFIPTSEYDVPRWHRDGYYYAPYEGNPYKFAVTLKGPSTLFYNLPNDLKKEFSDLERTGTEKNGYNRQTLATFLGQSQGNTRVPQPYQGAIFIVGSEYAAIHSEPPIHEERLFISVLPGSQKQIKEWKDQ